MAQQPYYPIRISPKAITTIIGSGYIVNAILFTRTKK